MALYRVRVGCALPRHGELVAAGTVLDLEPAVATEANVAALVEAVTETASVAPPPNPKPVPPPRPVAVATVVEPKRAEAKTQSTASEE